MMVHAQFMQQAIEIARKGNPSPNPYVGCVIVKEIAEKNNKKKNNKNKKEKKNPFKVIATGYHKKAGEPHAEINALSRIKNSDAKDSIIYINLEPCTFFGRTPPCVERIIKAKPKEVVIAMLDPNPKVFGNGVKKLREAGIKVTLGVLEHEAKELNKIYIKYMTTGLPYVFMKSAMTLNWKISWGDGKNKRITSKEANNFVHGMRNKVDAILVGINTVLKDNPHLTVRLDKPTTEIRNPLRVILDSELKIPLTANVLRDNNVVIFTASMKKTKTKEILRARGIRVFVFRERGKLSIKKALWILGKLGITSVLIEGGARVNTSAVNAKVVDEIFFLVAPFVINDPNSMGVFSEKMDNLYFRKISVNKLGGDFIINAVPRYE